MVSHQDKRMGIIDKLRKTMDKLKEQGLGFDRKILINEICREHGTSQRTANEYINVVLSYGEARIDN